MAITLNTSSIATGQTIEARHVTQSAVALTGGEAFDITISGSLTTTGTNTMSSSASPSITSILTETDSFPLIHNVNTTGPAYRMDLKDVGGSGSAFMLLGNQAGGFASTGFAASYRTGSNASKGEIIMAIGKNGSPVQDRFIVQSEPGPIATNSTAELTLSVGGPSTDRTVLLNYQDSATSFTSLRVGNQASGTGTSFQKHVAMEYKNVSSSFAGFASSSENSNIGVSPASPPFGIVAGVNLGDPAFFIDQGGSLGATAPVTASLVISKNGHVTASGHGLFQAGKPIKTHTANLTASLANAGFYHIVGGTLTCSISISSAPIGAEYEFFQTQSGNFLFKSGSGISLISKNGSLRLAQLGSSAVLKKVGTSTYHLMGDLT